MTRKEFLKSLALMPMALSFGNTQSINHLFDTKGNDTLMPVIFVGHGSPMNALENNEFRQKWASLGGDLPTPKAILCVSAHWMTSGKTKVMGMANPKMIYDMYGFPKELYEINYGAPGAPELAKETQGLLAEFNVELDTHEWGFDHGCWVPLMHLFPEATIPVYQLSLDMKKPPEYHIQMAKELKALRKKGVLIIGSGNIVHNLRNIDYNPQVVYDWAKEFDEKSKELITNVDTAALADYRKIGSAAKMAIPTEDHYLPLLYSLSLLDDKQDNISFFNEKIVHGSISMRSVLIT